MSATANSFTKALVTNSTSGVFTAQVPATSAPSGAGKFDLSDTPYGQSAIIPSYILVIPIGTDTVDDTFDMRIYGWTKVVGLDVWVPQLLIDLSIVVGGSAVTAALEDAGGDDTFVADTIAVNDGAADNGPWRTVTSAEEDLASSVIVHTRGCRYITFDWDKVGAQEAVGMNALWRPLDT